MERRFPQAKVPWARVQVGRMETRPMRVPVYQGSFSRRMLVGFEQLKKRVAVFRLLGYGETLAAAQAMADQTLTASSHA